MAAVHLAPHDPDRDGPWDDRVAAHLLRRAGFGAAPSEIDEAVRQGCEATVEDLFDEAEEQEAEFQDTFERVRGTLVEFADPAQLQAWWCYRMMRTRTPLREKLTLFWHGHFATSFHKVEDIYLMHRQCETLREHAWGSLRDLVLAVSRDPAMLVYLDGEANTKEHPNENYARELLELFTLGIGHYTEKDVAEAARAFTGWHREGPRFVFHPEAHDDGRKQFLGRTGRFKGTDIVDVLMQQPATPRFIARKLLVFFACPEPSEEVVDEAAGLLARTHLNIAWFLRDLFQSSFFYSPACRRNRISSPVEFVVGTCRALSVRLAAQELKDHLTAMGQELFGPPNVKGWDGERKWIHSSAWAARTAFAQRVAELASEMEFGPNMDVAQLVPADLVDPKEVANLLVLRLLEGNLPEEARADLANLLVSNDMGPQPEQFRADPGFRDQQIRVAIGVILSLPEYHAC